MDPTNDRPRAEVTVAGEAEGVLSIAIAGRLDNTTLPDVWPQAMGVVGQASAKRVVIDASGVAYCDGSGLGLFAALRRLAASRGGQVDITGLAPGLQRLVGISTLEDPTAAELTPARPPGLVSRAGRATAEVLADVRDIIAFMGELTATRVWALLHPWQIRGRDLWAVAEKVGVDALPVMCLLGSLIGLIMAFQTAVPLQQYGAVSAIPTLLAISMIRELGPLITAIILAGRSGSAFAAEIGTMTVTQEISALRTFGLDPMRVLAVPRVLAAMLMTPLLAIFNIVTGILAGYIVMAQYGYSFQFYVNGVIGAVSHVDLIGGIGKTLAFGLIVAAIGCMRGLSTKTGPSAVGDSTTRAVVAGIVLIIIADMAFGVVYFYLGI